MSFMVESVHEECFAAPPLRAMAAQETRRAARIHVLYKVK
jgi:hypothetical protein